MAAHTSVKLAAVPPCLRSARRVSGLVRGTLVIVGFDCITRLTPTLLPTLKNEYRLRVVLWAEAGAEAYLPVDIKNALDHLRTLPKVANVNEIDKFSYDDLRQALAEERKAFPHRQLCLVCGRASSMAVGRLRREYGLRGPCDDSLLRFQCGGEFEALCEEEGLKHLRRVELRGGESYDGLVKAIGEGFVMKSAFEGRRVGGRADYQRLLRTRADGRWVRAQAYQEGQFFHIDSIYDGRRRLCQVVSAYSRAPYLTGGQALAGMPLSRGDEFDVTLRGFSNRVHRLLQPRDVSTHLDIVISDGQPWLVDVVAGPPAIGVQRCLQSNFSINFADLDLQVQTGLLVPTVEAEPIPAFWIRLGGGKPTALQGTCDEIDEAGDEGRYALVRHPSRDALKQDFERLKALGSNGLGRPNSRCAHAELQ